MPLFNRKVQIDGSKIWIWYISEDNNFFKEFLNLSENDHKFIDGLNKRRKREWLASRFLLKKYITDPIDGTIRKDKHGKPYIDQDIHHISITHSHDYTALIYSPQIVGIDIQQRVSKITRIAHKFVNKEEELYIGQPEVDYFHIIWGAKESMYKAYGRKAVDFKLDMSIKKFQIKNTLFKFYGVLSKEDIYQYQLYAEKMDEYYLVYAILDHL